MSGAAVIKFSGGCRVVKVGIPDEADEADADKAGAEAVVCGTSVVARIPDGRRNAEMNVMRRFIAKMTAAVMMLSQEMRGLGADIKWICDADNVMLDRAWSEHVQVSDWWSDVQK